MTPRGWVILLAVLLVLLGGLLILFRTPPAERDRSVLERELGFRGPVRRMVETQTQVGGSPRLGTQTTRIVTEIARDGRSARAVSERTYQRRGGETTSAREERHYTVSGPAGHEVVRASSRSADDRSETVRVFEGPCEVRSVLRTTSSRATSEEVTESRCDAAGRMLSQVTRMGGQETSRATYRWLPGGFAFQRLWVAPLGNRPAYQNNGFLRYDARSDRLDFWSPMANLKTRHTYDRRGNWIQQKTDFIPTPLSGNNVSVREMTYWDE